MTLQDVKHKLKNELNTNRYHHSVGVMKKAVKLAVCYGVDRNRAEIAGLLHDCAKFLKHPEALTMIHSRGIEVDVIQKRSPSLWHSILGPLIAREHYGITDTEILNAIYWHTTGRAGMTPLEKIIFVADFIENTRSFNGVEQAREVAFCDLNRCLLICCDLTIKHIIENGQMIHPYTIDTRNDALIKIEAGVKAF